MGSFSPSKSILSWVACVVASPAIQCMCWLCRYSAIMMYNVMADNTVRCFLVYVFSGFLRFNIIPAVMRDATVIICVMYVSMFRWFAVMPASMVSVYPRQKACAVLVRGSVFNLYVKGIPARVVADAISIVYIMLDASILVF